MEHPACCLENFVNVFTLLLLGEVSVFVEELTEFRFFFFEREFWLVYILSVYSVPLFVVHDTLAYVLVPVLL